MTDAKHRKTNKGWADLSTCGPVWSEPRHGTGPSPRDVLGSGGDQQCAESKVGAVLKEEHRGRFCPSSQELRFLPFTALLHVLSRMGLNGETHWFEW